MNAIPAADASDYRLLVPPPSAQIGKRLLSYVDVARMTVMLQPSWRTDPSAVAAWLALDEAFRSNPSGPWPIHWTVLQTLALHFQCRELDLTNRPADDYSYLMVCLHATNLSLSRGLSAPAPEGDPAAVDEPLDAPDQAPVASVPADNQGTGGAEKKAA